MRDEEVDVLAQSGVSHIGFGTESASEDILRAMNKAHQHIPDMFEAARKCARSGIRVTYNLIFGYPGEEEHHRRATFRVMAQIAEKFANVTFSPNVFTPYPGIPIWPQLKELGLAEPDSLEGWASMGLGQASLPWLPQHSNQDMLRGVSYFLLHNQLNKTKRKSQSPLLRTMLALLQKPLHWRLRNHFFDFPLELWVSIAQQWLIVRRSLLTGEALSHSLNGTR
jgi:hypothetical protein